MGRPFATNHLCDCQELSVVANALESDISFFFRLGAAGSGAAEPVWNYRKPLLHPNSLQLPLPISSSSTSSSDFHFK